jgi:hypothetical protein
MARRTFDVADVTELLVHWDAGRSQSEIATSQGLDRKTVKKYLAPALEAGCEPGSGRSAAQWAVLARDWFPQLADTRLRRVTWPAIEVHRDYVVAQLEAGATRKRCGGAGPRPTRSGPWAVVVVVVVGRSTTFAIGVGHGLHVVEAVPEERVGPATP